MPEHSDQSDHEKTYTALKSMRDEGFLLDYEILVLSGCSAKVYYPYKNWLKFIYFKLKAWAILKIQKKK